MPLVKSKHLFLSSLFFLVFIYGVFVGHTKFFPYIVVDQAKQGLESLLGRLYLGGYTPAGIFHPIPGVDTTDGFWVEEDRDVPNILILEWGPDRSFFLRVIDGDGITQYLLDLAETERQLAKAKTFEWPTSEVGGKTIHGMALCPDGTVLLNFVRYGLVKIDLKGNVLWAAGYFTHHSVELDHEGNIWACGLAMKNSPRLVETIACFNESGKLIKEWVLDDLLVSNGILGLNSIELKNKNLEYYHLNDVEPYNLDTGEGYFKQGDILISLRDVSTVLVFNSKTDIVTFQSNGFVSHQHDPDFIDGNRISVFDNQPGAKNNGSRVVEMYAPTSSNTLTFSGTKDVLFYTKIMGCHAVLPSGNKLLVESTKGRILLVNPEGQVFMTYTNYHPNGKKGLISNAIPLLGEVKDKLGLP
ncbi:MAG: hypothetical protein HYZ16_11595 [Bacteroidetes bacterium]|nr:hypothetical protein [Bacteroidota bacterium]